MKKFLCLFLSLLMTLSVFSVLSVTTFAVDESAGEYESYGYVDVRFEPSADNESFYKPYKYSNGYWEYVQNEGTGVWSFEFFYNVDNIFLAGNKLIFIDAEGNEVTYTCTDDFVYCTEDGAHLDETNLAAQYCVDDEGNAFVKITFEDLICEYPVVFEETPIVSVTVNNTPQALEAYVDGGYYRLASGENAGDVAFFYDTLYCEGVQFVVAYADGTEEVFTFNEDEFTFIDGEGNCMDENLFSFNESQDYEEWQAGGTYAVDCYYKGFGFSITYVVSENAVKSVSYEQAKIPQFRQNWDGEMSYCDCDEEGYFEYDINQKFPEIGDKITVTYVDDTVTEFVLGDNFYYTDTENPENVLPYEVMVNYHNQEAEHWGVGENTFYVSVYGHKVELTAEVVTNEITGISISPVRIIENNGGYWETNEDGSNEFYVYDQPYHFPGVTLTVTFNGEETLLYTYNKETDWFVDEAGNSFPHGIGSTTTEQYEEPWGVGTHTLPVDILGVEIPVQVTVVANPVQTVVLVPAEPFTFAYEQDGEWSTAYDLETGEEIPAFIYDTSVYSPYMDGNKLEVYYKNGSKDVFTYNEDEGKFINAKGVATSPAYDIEMYDVQEFAPWTMENPDNNYFVVDFMGVPGVARVTLDNGEKPVPAKISEVYNGDGSVSLIWANEANAESYEIYRRTEKADGSPSSGKWECIGATTDWFFIDDTVGDSSCYYRYMVHSKNAYGLSTYMSARTMLVKYVPPVKNLKVSPATNGISIKWDAFDGQIAIFRRAGGETEWTYLATLDGKQNAVVDPNAQSGKYYVYAAMRVDGEAMSLEKQSNVIKYLATPDLQTIKNAVSGIYFNWTKVAGAAGYRVYRRAAGEKYYKLIATTKNLWYCDQSVRNNNGVYYKYTVKAISGDYLSACEDGLLLKRLAIPSMVSVTNATDGVVVKWNKLAGATEYRVYRRGAGQTVWSYIGSTKDLQFLDKGVRNASGNYYRYTVRAVFGKVYGGFDTNGLVILRLGTPEITRVKNDKNGIKVEFNAVKGATGYYVYHKTGKSSWVRVGTTTKTSFVDSNVTAGTYYTYTVKAYRGSYMSAFKATDTSLVHVPAPVVQTPVNAEKGVEIKWEEVPMAEKYYVGRRDVGGTWQTIKVINKADVKKNRYGLIYYVDTTAAEGKTYDYSVRAYAKGTSSGYSENHFGTFLPPVDVLSAKNTDGGIKITWEKSPKASGYVIWRSTEGGSSPKAYNVENATSFVDENVTSGKTYTYEVWAIGGPDAMSSASVPGASKSCTAK